MNYMNGIWQRKIFISDIKHKKIFFNLRSKMTSYTSYTSYTFINY